MSRFAAPDLASLGLPPALNVLDTETLFQQRMAKFKDKAKEHDFDYNVGHLETDPISINQQVSAYFDTLSRAKVNDGIRAVLLATAQGGQLDQIAATYYGISRLEGEKDNNFKLRIALAPEAWSTAGPEGAYIFHGLESDPNVRDVAVYSEEDSAVYADGSPVLAPEVLTVVLSHEGNGNPEPSLMDKVAHDISGKEVRPIGDKVTVEPAIIHEYEIHAVLKYKQGSDAELLRLEAEKRLDDYLDKRRYISRVHQRAGINAALMVSGIEEIELLSPATDIDPGSKGAGFCTKITITTETAPETWR